MLHSNQPDIKSLEIREVRADDIAVLERLFPKQTPNKHAERLAIQTDRKAVYLIAIQHGKPVGHVLLLWDGLSIPAVIEKFKNTPAIEDLHVDKIYRGRGIEEELLEECYKRLKEKGVQMLGISIPKDEIEQKAFFHSQTFIDSGLPEYFTTWPVLDDLTGSVKTDGELCRYFVKHF